MKSHIKRTIAILLLVCFLVSLTATAVSATCQLRSKAYNNAVLIIVCRDQNTLTKGDQNTGVKEIQRSLIRFGYSIPSGATGYYGDETYNAVRNYQKAEGIHVSGKVGSTTLAHLDNDQLYYEMTH